MSEEGLPISTKQKQNNDNNDQNIEKNSNESKSHQLPIGTKPEDVTGKEILEIGYVLPRPLPDSAREINAAALHDDVDVVAGTAQEAVTDIAADHKGADAPLGSDITDYPEDGPVQKLVGYRWHSISS